MLSKESSPDRIQPAAQNDKTANGGCKGGKASASLWQGPITWSWGKKSRAEGIVESACAVVASCPAGATWSATGVP